MWVEQIVLGIIGFSSGAVIAGGMFSFLIGLGLISVFADRTHTGKHILMYENAIALGGILFNLFFIYQIKIPAGQLPSGAVRSVFRNLCGLLGHGACRYSQCISDLYTEAENH